MDGDRSAFEGPDPGETFEAVARDVFAGAGAGGVCCNIIEYTPAPDGGLPDPPTDPPEGMARPVYCWKHERWMDVPLGHRVLYTPETDYSLLPDEDWDAIERMWKERRAANGTASREMWEGIQEMKATRTRSRSTDAPRP